MFMGSKKCLKQSLRLARNDQRETAIQLTEELAADSEAEPCSEKGHKTEDGGASSRECTICT